MEPHHQMQFCVILRTQEKSVSFSIIIIIVSIPSQSSILRFEVDVKVTGLIG